MAHRAKRPKIKKEIVPRLGPKHNVRPAGAHKDKREKRVEIEEWLAELDYWNELTDD